MPASFAVLAHWSVSQSLAANKLMFVTPGVHSLPEKVLKDQQTNMPKRSCCNSVTRRSLMGAGAESADGSKAAQAKRPEARIRAIRFIHLAFCSSLGMTTPGSFRRSLEQLGCELIEVFAPVDPGVRAFGFLVNYLESVLLEHLHGGAGRRDEEIVLAGGKPE